MAPSRRMRGTTLVELMAALAVLAVVLGFGAPLVSRWGARIRADGTASEVVSSLAYARITAVSRNEAVTLCPSADGERCTSGTDWSVGWIAYADPLHGDQPATPDRVLHRFGALPASIRLTSTSGRPRVRFQPEGWAAGTNVTLQLCVGGQPTTQVVLNNAGRARVDHATGRCPSA